MKYKVGEKAVKQTDTKMFILEIKSILEGDVYECEESIYLNDDSFHIVKHLMKEHDFEKYGTIVREGSSFIFKP